MKKPTLTLLTAAMVCLAGIWTSPLAAQEIIGIGVHLGAHHDVGNLSGQDNNILHDPQNSLLAGFSLKANMAFLFFRTGCDVSMLANRSNVYDDTPVIEHSSLSYLSLPAFLGVRYPLKDIGELYMGAGMAYFIGTGEVKLAASATADDVEAIALGYGFVTGIEFKLLQFLNLYMEWEYFDVRSDPVLTTAGSTWDDFYIDFSGHRILVGAMYYLL